MKIHPRLPFVLALLSFSRRVRSRFRKRMVAMYAGYNTHVAPLTGFVSVGRHIVALNASGRLVLVFSADCVFWNETNEFIARAFHDFARAFPGNGIERGTAGKAIPLFARKMRAISWTFHAQSASRLLGEQY